MKRFFLLIFIAISAIELLAQSAQIVLPLIPKPKSINLEKGSFVVNNSTIILADKNSFEAKYLKECIQNYYGFNLSISENYVKDASIISLSLAIPDTTVFDKEAYQLLINPNRISITAAGTNGLFYGIQTLLQLLPLEKNKEIKVGCVNIIDAPKYNWRGMHLDVSRHFFQKAFVKKYIDYLAMYKMNTFHWHLTDDQGWRIEIKKYPKLTDIGGWRKGSMVGHYNEQKIDSFLYGGYYTQDDIKEIVAYAAERHITIVPEIEFPGHAMAAITAYPEFSCTGGPFEVATTWGVFDDVFCPKEETFTFLEDILSEVIELFPSQYIHIGGDECPKTRWKTCKNCQSVIKREGLKDEDELQSYFITRLEKFVNSKNRKIIGWDEILEGGLAPNAAVMSWRGTKGGIEAAKLKHFVVMSPGSHCYFDHYQGEPKNEPIAIGGFTTVEKVYSYQPTPKELSADESKYILGAQGNVWTEYINLPENVEYMALPRMAALAEVVWGTANTKQYQDFEKRLTKHFDLLDHKGINYSKSIYQITTKVSPNKDGSGILLNIATAFDVNKIKYSFDDEPLNLNSPNYFSPLIIDKNTRVKVAYFENGKQKSSTIEQPFYISKSTGKKITLKFDASEKYSSGNPFALVNGVLGDSVRRQSDWLGFRINNLEATIDLQKLTPFSQIKLNFLKDPANWIHYPKRLEIMVSEDGKSFITIGVVGGDDIRAMKGNVTINFTAQNARYVKIIAVHSGKIADGNPGVGSDSWLFIDEILID